MKTGIKLKRCPFCGGKAKHLQVDTVPINDPHFGGEYIECIKCKASTSIMFPLMDSIDELLAEKWNNRI